VLQLIVELGCNYLAKFQYATIIIIINKKQTIINLYFFKWILQTKSAK